MPLVPPDEAPDAGNVTTRTCDATIGRREHDRAALGLTAPLTSEILPPTDAVDVPADSDKRRLQLRCPH